MLDTEASAPVKQAPSLNPAGTVIGLGPINIPEYLNRPQMVIGTGEYEYRLDENHRWAERLDQNIGRVLLQTLSDKTSFQIVRHPWSSRQRIDYQVSLDILEFHLDNYDNSRMSVNWTIKNRQKTFSAKTYACKLPVPKDDFDTLVKTQSQCLDKLGQEIAETLNSMTISDITGKD